MTLPAFLTIGFALTAGYLLTRLVFERSDIIETMVSSFVMAVSCMTVMGLLLGYNETFMMLTGGLTRSSVWAFLTGLNIALAAMLAFRAMRRGKGKRAPS